jgi:tyrosyl-tRNA synthetase
MALDGAEGLSLLDILDRLGFIASRGEARRMARQGALSVDGERVSDPTRSLAAGTWVVRLGKRKYARVVLQ